MFADILKWRVHNPPPAMMMLKSDHLGRTLESGSGPTRTRDEIQHLSGLGSGTTTTGDGIQPLFGLFIYFSTGVSSGHFY
ncbi:unnamed protein product [Arabis nemorensis]|uniref:Uncharacterized protein n=1 Tax=Arabis nemorensis TaxID=586526 RepID=A0A565C4R0_9BRAS|nr:unnamed protein product [Arabis nemorensis]